MYLTLQLVVEEPYYYSVHDVRKDFPSCHCCGYIDSVIVLKSENVVYGLDSVIPVRTSEVWVWSTDR